MLLGFTPFNNEAFQSALGHTEIYNMTVKNGKFDEIKIDEGIENYTNVKELWDYNTIFQALFKDNLNAGNVDFLGLMVSKLRIKRRKLGEFEWQTLGEWDFDKTKKYYEMFDKYIEAHEIYEYTIVPVLDDNTEGNLINVGEITTDFEGLFLVDKTNDIRLIWDLEFGGIDVNQDEDIMKPVNSKYPITVSNSTIDYLSGSVTTTIISPTNKGNGYDIRQEKLYRQKIMDFLRNKKAKLMKIGNGESMIIRIIKPRFEPFNGGLQQHFGKVKFDWVQIGDANDIEQLKNNGLL